MDKCPIYKSRARKPTVLTVGVSSPACLQEIAEYLRDKYILNDVEYGGIQIGKMPAKEEA